MSFQSSVRGTGAFTFSVFNMDLSSVGVSVLLWVQKAGPSRVDVTYHVNGSFGGYWSVLDIYQS